MKTQKLDLIQVLRGIAAISVVFYHASGQIYRVDNYQYLGGAFDKGWVGVDFFFALSGFIIFYANGSDIGQPSRFTEFITRRAIRIFPIYWLITGILIPIYFLHPTWGTGTEHQYSSIFESILLIPYPKGPIVGVAWSLSYEILFYLIFACLIALPKKLSAPLVATWITATIANAIFAFSENTNFYFQFLLSPYHLEFLFGCVAGFIFKRTNHRNGWVIFFAGATTFLISISMMDGDGTSGRGHAMTTLILGASAAVTILGAASAGWRPTGHSGKFAVYLGAASYSIYLSHFTIIIAVVKFQHHIHLSTNAYTTLTILIAVACGLALHRYVEAPILAFLTKHVTSKRPKTENLLQPIS